MNAAVLCMVMTYLSSVGEIPLSKSRLSLACKMSEHVVSESKKNNLRPSLVMALIYIESGWKRNAVSSAGACGLTQVIPKWTGSPNTGVPKLTCKKLFNPKTSITMGTRLMKFWIKNYAQGNEQVGLCGYNSGYRCKVRRVKGKVLKPNKKGMRYARVVLSTERKILSGIGRINK